MKIAILGTRGIPNNYGGFEQFAEFLSIGLVNKGHEVWVYSPHNHKYLQPEWNGVKLIHKFDPEYKIGTAGQFLYDLNCILDSRKRGFDIILQLGYTSSSIWNFLFKRPAIIVTNMDGLEWKRTKYSKRTQNFLKYAERTAVKRSDSLVSDSLGIKKYLYEKYSTESDFIPYGAETFKDPDESVLTPFKLRAYNYDLLIARLEPENNIDVILEGFSKTNTGRQCIVVGNEKTHYGAYLVNKYAANKKIIFLGSIYDMKVVNNLRYFSNLYFHGHSVGGTNPSLLEAMASNALIAAHHNAFNASILEGDAYYFMSADEVATLISGITKDETQQNKIEANKLKIESLYSWRKIVNDYECVFLRLKS